MKIIISFLFLIFTQIITSQSINYQYLDAYYTKINHNLFQKKLKSELFDIATFNKDSITYKKLRFKEYYGKLDKNKFSQLKKFFHKRYEIDSLKTLAIHFLDTLPNIQEMPKKSGIVILDSLNNPISEVLSTKEFYLKMKNSPIKRHKHVLKAEDYLKEMEDEIINFDKKLKLIHFYNFNKGIPEKKLQQLNYFQDQNTLIQRTFSDGNKNYQTILLYPNGEFYVSMFRNSKKEKKLRKKRKFDRLKKKWQRKIYKLSK